MSVSWDGSVQRQAGQIAIVELCDESALRPPGYRGVDPIASVLEQPYDLRHRSHSLFQGRVTIKNGYECTSCSVGGVSLPKVMGAFLSPAC